MRLHRPSLSGKKKPNKHTHFGWDGSGQTGTGPSLGQNQEPSLKHNRASCLGQTGRYFVTFVPGTGPSLSLGRLSRKGRQINVYVFCVYRLFPQSQKTMAKLLLIVCVCVCLELFSRNVMANEGNNYRKIHLNFLVW